MYGTTLKPRPEFSEQLIDDHADDATVNELMNALDALMEPYRNCRIVTEHLFTAHHSDRHHPFHVEGMRGMVGCGRTPFEMTDLLHHPRDLRSCCRWIVASNALMPRVIEVQMVCEHWITHTGSPLVTTLREEDLQLRIDGTAVTVKGRRFTNDWYKDVANGSNCNGCSLCTKSPTFYIS